MRDLVTQMILPMRDARQQFEMAGAESSVHSFNAQTQIYYVGGKGGPCAMPVTEWVKYQAICAKWASGPLDLEGEPGLSMLEATAEEDDELEALRRREPSHFARSFREIEQCLLAHTRCIRDDERDEIVRQIAAKIMPLKKAVLRAEEIWLEDHTKVRVTVNGHQLSALLELIEPDFNEELHLANHASGLAATIKAEDHEAEWVLTAAGKFDSEGGAA